jgi:hypothetical protein
MGASAVIGMMGAGVGMQAMGAYNQASQQRAALENQAQIAEWQAQQSLAAGVAQTNNSQLKTGSLIGEQRAQLAASGVDLGSGSANDILTSSRFMGDRDALTISDNATRTAWAYRTNADISRTMASNINPMMSMATSLIGGAGQVAATNYRMKAQGLDTGTGTTVNRRGQ